MKSQAVTLTLLLMLAATAARAETRRLAIVVGNNAGSEERAPLRYAESDAGKMARVLVELGDVQPDDVMLLQGQRVEAVERAITEARERVQHFKRSPDVRSVVYFYFSGHSDGEAIELGREKLAYPRLKALLSGTGADVRLVVVDACRSGGGLREKGGKPADGFTIRLSDTLQATGEVFISSSAADESALESSEVMGSYFTHNFISGLRGAADASGDKQVTLAEAYQYAYDRTVSSTAMLAVGAQHPNYDFRLSGQGELVLSSLLKPSALLSLPAADRTLVTDLARDQVVVEVVGGGRDIALAPGQYGVRLFKDGQGYGSRVTLVDGQRSALAMSAFSPIHSGTFVAAKGGPLVVQQMDRPKQFTDNGLGISAGATNRLLGPGLRWQLRLDFDAINTTIVRFGGGRLFGSLSLLGLGESSFETMNNEAGAQLRIGYRLSLELWRFQFGLGIEVGPGVLAQLYDGNAMAVTFNAAPRLSVRFRVAQAVAIVASGDISVTGYNARDAVGEYFNVVAWPSANAGLMFYF